MLAIGLALTAGQHPSAAQPVTGAEPLAALRAMDQRLAAIAYRLAVANLGFCADRDYAPGFAVHDLSQYDATERAAVIRVFGLDAGPGVLALVAGSAAERAGLRLDDILTSADGTPMPHAGTLPSAGGFTQMERILAALDESFADGRVVLAVRRRGTPLSIAVAAEQGCASRFQLVPGRSLNARADGRYVQVTTALAQYAADDQELAAILAHEFAHNVLGHRIRLDAAGVRRGLFRNFGRNARLTREAELEADRLAPYLLDRAGYDPEAAVRFWRRFGRRGLNIFGSPTHGGWGRRAEAIAAEIALIRQARRAGQVPVPGFVHLPIATRPAS